MSRRQITSFIPLQPAGRRVEAWPAEPGTSCEQLSWWEPRSPATPRVEGSDRTVLAWGDLRRPCLGHAAEGRLAGALVGEVHGALGKGRRLHQP
jgi:hypothetical protein